MHERFLVRRLGRDFVGHSRRTQRGAGKRKYIWARSVLETISDTKFVVVEKNLEGRHL